MSDSNLETWVTRFFAAREADATLTAAAFLAHHADAPAALANALDTAAELAGLLGGDVPGPSQRLGPYTIVRELGRGGMGVVYEVERNGTRAALKLLPPWGAAREHARARFAREADALRRLDHPGVVRVLDVGGDEDAPWLVMELIAGTSIAAQRGPLPPTRAATLLAAVAEATAAAHAAGIVHRDIKPANVLLRADGSPVLVDFGLASLADEAGLTASGDLLGTPRYMAPEQAAGAVGDAQSDVYALGLVLHELLTGLPARTSDSREEALRVARRGGIEPLAKIRADLPVGVRTIVAKATALRPHRRYASADELADDLRRFAHGEAVRGRAPGVLTNTFDTVFATRGRSVLAALTLLTLAAIGALWGLARYRTQQAIAAHIDLALGAYLVGADHTARAEAERGLQLGEDPMLRGLRAALDPAPLAPGDLFGAALGALRQRPADAAEAWAQSTHHAAVVLETAARLTADDTDRAARCATAIAPSDPRLSARIVLAQVRASGGETDVALALLTVTPDDAPTARLALPMARARLALRFGRLEDGAQAAREAAQQGSTEVRGLTGLLVDLLESAADRPALRAVVSTAVAAEPDDAELRFALAYSFDVDHDIAAAAAEYERLLARTPDHAHSLICLAHLHSGADRETCVACANAFAEHPELIDPTRASALALRALAAAGTHESAVLEAGARVALAAGATTELTAWLTHAKTAGSALTERIDWWLRRCERAGR